jgi:2-octaprenyl-6-methoxyphenol hydroxylase
MYDYDLVIIGGGLVGGSLACALSSSSLRVAVIEAVPPQIQDQPSYDERVIALSLGSRRIFETVGLWPDIAPEAEPILKVHVSERGGCGFTRLDQAEEGVEALGYVAPARTLGIAIRSALRYAPNVELLCPARLTCYRTHSDGVDLEVQLDGEPQRLRTRLLVAADGGDSMVRARLNPKVRQHDYGYDAIITTVMPDRPRTGVAYERFTETGPLAMLPMTGGRYSVVWTSRESETPDLLALSDRDFLERLQERFGYRLGCLGQLAPRRAYPLSFMLVRKPVGERVALIGNAAHTLHPVAGQGFNLGLRDVAALAESLMRGADPGSPATLAEYLTWRGRDQLTTATLTDGLARLFTIPWLSVRAARGAALLGLDLSPAARHLVAKRFMGLNGRSPRRARGSSMEHVHD